MDTCKQCSDPVYVKGLCRDHALEAIQQALYALGRNNPDKPAEVIDLSAERKKRRPMASFNNRYTTEKNAHVDPSLLGHAWNAVKDVAHFLNPISTHFTGDPAKLHQIENFPTSSPWLDQNAAQQYIDAHTQTSIDAPKALIEGAIPLGLAAPMVMDTFKDIRDMGKAPQQPQGPNQARLEALGEAIRRVNNEPKLR